MNPHGSKEPRDFKSLVSASSTTSAHKKNTISKTFLRRRPDSSRPVGIADPPLATLSLSGLGTSPFPKTQHRSRGNYFKSTYKNILRRRPDSNRRIEVLQTSPLATWVRRLFIKKKSERRDSNPRPQPWQGCALPTELLSLIEQKLYRLFKP